MTDGQIEHMTQRFLSWRLPQSFNPDNGISFTPDHGVGTSHPGKYEPIGTNLFTAAEAEAMIRHLVDGISDA